MNPVFLESSCLFPICYPTTYISVFIHTLIVVEPQCKTVRQTDISVALKHGRKGDVASILCRNVIWQCTAPANQICSTHGLVIL